MTGGTKKIPIGTFRAELASHLDQVSAGKQRLILERHGAPVAALVSIGDFHRLNQQEVRMARRIIFTNISGGEGKSFFTFHIAFLLADMGYRVAVIDGDPQASLTKRLGLHDDPESAAHSAEHTILPVFTESANPTLPPPLVVGSLHVWPANRSLGEADSKISADIEKVGALHEALEGIDADYDFVLLDSKPGVSPLLAAVTAAADHVMVPVSADKGMENLDELARLIKNARRYNHKVGIRLFLPNRTKTTNLSRRVQEALAEYSNIAPLAPGVRESTVGGEAENARQGVSRYAPKSTLTGDLRSVVEQLLAVTGSRSAQEVIP